MAWNQPADDKSAKPRRSSGRGSVGQGRLRRWRQRWKATPRARGPFYATAAGLVVVLFIPELPMRGRQVPGEPVLAEEPTPAEA